VAEGDKGTYALLMAMTRVTDLNVGSLGRLRAAPGYYIYVGSAFGPGGLHARVGRHLRSDKKTRWHIDYLTGHVSNIEAYCQSDGRNECLFADSLAALGGAAPFRGFGSSDCNCASHLLFFQDAAPFMRFVQQQRLIRFE
jgi:Uri superfamily endonuclease